MRHVGAWRNLCWVPLFLGVCGGCAGHIHAGATCRQRPPGRSACPIRPLLPPSAPAPLDPPRPARRGPPPAPSRASAALAASPAGGRRPARVRQRPGPPSSSSPPFLQPARSPESAPGSVRKRVRPLPRPPPGPGPGPRLPAGGPARSQAGPEPGTGTRPSGAVAPALRRQPARLADRSCARNCPAPPRSTREGEYAAAGPGRARGEGGERLGVPAAWPPAPRRGQGGGRARHVGAARVRVRVRVRVGWPKPREPSPWSTF